MLGLKPKPSEHQPNITEVITDILNTHNNKYVQAGSPEAQTL